MPNLSSLPPDAMEGTLLERVEAPVARSFSPASRYSAVFFERDRQEATRYMQLRAEMQEIMAQPNVTDRMLDRWKALSTESNTLAHAFIGVMELRFQAAERLD